MDIPIIDQMTYVFQTEFGLYAVFAAFIFGFILSFAVGANDSSNSWGTPVGAKTVTLGIAFLFGSICEAAGSIFLSQNVIDGISGETSIIKMSLYKSDNATEMQLFEDKEYEKLFMKERTLMLGLITSMVASQIWQLTATKLGWPVSGTHTIISSLMGFTLVENGTNGVNIGNPKIWKSSGIFKVMYGLLLAPIMGLFLGFLIYYPIYKYAVKSQNQSSWTCRIIYSLCVFVIMMAITFFFVVLNVTPPSGFTHMTFGVLLGGCVGILFALIFVSLHNKILAMTGEFQFSLNFISNAAKKVRQTFSRRNNEFEENVNEGILNNVSIQKNEIENEPTKKGDVPSCSTDSNTTLDDELDDVFHNRDKNSPRIIDNLISDENTQLQDGKINNRNTHNGTSIHVDYGTMENNSTVYNNSGSELLNAKSKETIDESDQVKRVFQPLQFLTACYAAINHGSNDVANCIGPLVTAWMIYKSPLVLEEPTDKILILTWGAIGICMGLIFYGEKVIVTMGTKICKMTPSMGFSVVLASSILVMMASITGLPVSTTHCQVMGIVGASVAKGWIDSGSFNVGLRSFDSGLIRNIAMSWVITIPCALLVSMCVYAPSRALIIGPFGQ